MTLVPNIDMEPAELSWPFAAILIVSGIGMIIFGTGLDRWLSKRLKVQRSIFYGYYLKNSLLLVSIMGVGVLLANNNWVKIRQESPQDFFSIVKSILVMLFSGISLKPNDLAKSIQESRINNQTID